MRNERRHFRKRYAGAKANIIPLDHRPFGFTMLGLSVDFSTMVKFI